MSIAAQACYLFGTLLFANSAYSSYELNQLAQLSPEGGAGVEFGAVPKDLVVEAVVAGLLFLVGALMGIDGSKNRPLGPLSDVSEQAVASVTKSPLRPVAMAQAMAENEVQGFTPFDKLENRMSFVDWTAKRAAYSKATEKKLQ